MIEMRIVMGVLYLIALFGFIGGFMANTQDIRFMLIGVVFAFMYPTLLLLMYLASVKLQRKSRGDEDEEMD